MCVLYKVYTVHNKRFLIWRFVTIVLHAKTLYNGDSSEEYENSQFSIRRPPTKHLMQSENEQRLTGRDADRKSQVVTISSRISIRGLRDVATDRQRFDVTDDLHLIDANRVTGRVYLIEAGVLLQS